jgi:transcriptional regulator with XRE-family HTH domain
VPLRFGQNVRAARHARGLTQEELAHLSDLSVVQISRIERGTREIRLSTVVKLLRALEIEPNQLFDGLARKRSGRK